MWTINRYIAQVHASMAVFWYLDDIVLDWIGQTGPGLGAKVVETRGKVNFHDIFLEFLEFQGHEGNVKLY